MNNTYKIYILIIFTFSNIFSQNEALPKTVRRYIRPSISLDYYGTTSKGIYNYRLLNFQRLRTRRNANDEIDYSFRMVNFNFTLPLFTKTWENPESMIRPTFHFILNGNAISALPNFSEIEDKHRLTKVGLGLRAIYSDGKKSTFFVNFSPFFSQDQTTIRNPTLRVSALLVYNYTFSQKFSFRVGLSKSYMLAELGYFLPVLGFRYGKLDGVYFSFNIPRNVSINFPLLKNKLYASVYTKPIGGIFNYDNSDNSLAELNENASKERIGTNIQYRFYEILTGFLVEYKPNSNFTMFASLGFSTDRTIGFASDENRKFRHKSVAILKVRPTVFLNIGATITFGQAKKTYNNSLLEDAFYLNQTFDAADMNTGNRDLRIDKNTANDSPKTIKSSDIDYKDIKDLVYDAE